MRAELEREYVEYVTHRMATLRRTAYQLCGDPHRGDDPVQQALTKLYGAWRRARDTDNLDAYLRRILLRVFLDERRLAWSKVRLVESAPDTAAGSASGTAQVDDRLMLQTALRRVAPRQRAVLVLRFLEDLSVAEVAEAMGLTEGTVKSHTHHGLTTLRTLLGERGPAIEGSIRHGR